MKPHSQFELVISFDVWRSALMRLSADPNLIAASSLERDPWRDPTGLLAYELQLSLNAKGADYPPIGDWMIVAAPGGEPPIDPEAWVRRLEPCFAQLLVVLLVGFGPDRTDWRGWVIERGQVQPLVGLRIIGPGMVHVGHLPVDRTEDQLARGSRLRGALGERIFTKVHEFKVAVIGCSRSGTIMASTLAALGVGEIILIDGDQIEPHNLDGMILSREEDLGASKAIALGQRLVEFRSDLLVKAVPKPFANRAAELNLAGVDLVVTCVDRDAPRLRAARWAREYLTIHLDIGAGVTRTDAGDRQLAADVRLMLPGSGCVCCVGGLADREQAEYEFHIPPGALPRRSDENWGTRGRLGSLITLNSLAVSIGVQSWLDLLDGSLGGSIWHRLRWVPGVGLQANAALVGSAPRCEVCG
jgi:hypothetical protein